MSIAEKFEIIADEVYGKGKQAEYDAFWDGYQDYGNRTSCENLFASSGWSTAIFKPKYDVYPVNAYGMFRYCGMEGDLVEILNKLGRTISFENATSMQYTFAYANFTRVGVIDTRNQDTIFQTFQTNTKLKTIDLLILRNDGSQKFEGVFTQSPNIEGLTIEGVIGQNGFNMQWSAKLNKASITSIINALSETASGLTVTLSKTAKENAFTDEEWAALIAEKPNWTISLV